MVAQFLDESVISTDAGNGWVSAYRAINGKMKQYGMPHARARVTGAQLDADILGGSQVVIDYADFRGQRYGIGDNVLTMTDAPIDVHQNTARRYGSEAHIFFMLTSIAKLGVKSGEELTLIVPAPPGLLNSVSKPMKQAIRAGEDGSGSGVWSIELREDKKPRIFTIKRVITVPEGAGAYAAFRFTQDGEIVTGGSADALAGRVSVLDLGAGTGDVYSLINGNLAPDAIAHATDDRAGVIHNLLKPILAELVGEYPRATFLTTAHIDSYLRAYKTTGAAEVRIAGKLIKIDGLIDAYCRRYAEYIAANKIDPLWSAGADAVIAAGGGWVYIMDSVRGMYADRVLITPADYKHTAKIPLWDLNGVGGLHLFAAMMRSAQT